MALFKLEDSFFAFDSPIGITLCIEDNTAKKQHAYSAFMQVRELCERFEQLFSRTISTSDVSRINQAQGNAVAVSPYTANLISAALPYCQKSGGVFDITAGCITPLWDFKKGICPTQQELDQALQHVSWEKVTVDGTSVQLLDAASAIDLGGIAKGWIADRLGEALLQQGFENFLVNLGGNILTHGTNPQDNPWVIQVTNPVAGTSEAPLVKVTHASVVTSGTYQRFFTQNGRLLHHILNPKTGYPAESDAVSATIICEKSLDAEGFSTTALALGIEKGRAFCAAQPEILAAYFIDANGTVFSYAKTDSI